MGQQPVSHKFIVFADYLINERKSQFSDFRITRRSNARPRGRLVLGPGTDNMRRKYRLMLRVKALLQMIVA